MCPPYSHGSVGRMLGPQIRTEGDVDRCGRGLDVAEYGPLRRHGSKELPPAACLRGHIAPRFLWGHEPGYGRTFWCTVDGCDSRQVRHY